MPSITLPADFPVVGFGVLSTVILQVYQQMNVGKARKTSGVDYPTMLVTESEAKADPKKMAYNCVQRAHGNTLENVPYVLGMFSFNSIFHPKLSTAFVILWSVGRAFYTMNYSTGKPNTRNNGPALLHYVGMLGLLLTTMYTSVSKLLV